MVSQIYLSELQLNKANTSDKEVACLELHLSISYDIVSTEIYDKRDDFDFEIVNFPFQMVMLLALGFWNILTDFNYATLTSSYNLSKDC